MKGYIILVLLTTYACIGMADDYDNGRYRYDSNSLYYPCKSDMERLETSGELMSSIRALTDDYMSLDYSCQNLIKQTPLYVCQDDIYNLCNGDSLPILEPVVINDTVGTTDSSTGMNLNTNYGYCVDRPSTKAAVRQMASPMLCLANHASELSHMCSREFNKTATAACASDIAQFCSDEKPHKTFKCLFENRDELSYDCQSYIPYSFETKDAKLSGAAYFFGTDALYQPCESGYQTYDDYSYGCHGWRVAAGIIVHVLIFGAVACCLCRCIRRCRARRCRNAQGLSVAVPIAVPVMQVPREMGSMTAVPTAPADGTDNYQRIL